MLSSTEKKKKRKNEDDANQLIHQWKITYM